MNEPANAVENGEMIDQITDLTPEQQALLMLRLLKKGGKGQDGRVPQIKAAARSTDIPLSFAQQRLWFLDQLEPGSAAYNIRVALRLEGTLNLAALAASFDEIVRRHESLRTSFVLIEGQPVQVIRAQAAPLGPQLTDLSDLSKAEQIAQVQELASSEAQRPFKLAEGPLIRVRLLRLGEQEHVLLLTMHHIISDGWSMGILFRELSALYRGYSQGAKPELPELGVQYADYAVWQREYLSGAVLEEQLGYWKEQLRGAPAVMELPTDRARPAVQSYRGRRQRVRLSAGLTEQLQELSRREDVTLFMTLLAAFQVLLGRYSGQSEVVVGTPVANRNRGEIEGVIGFFLNTLALRTDLSGEPTFRELLARVKRTALGAYAHQDLPFEKLVEELQPERSSSHTPIVQVMFNLRNLSDDRISLPGIEAVPLPNPEPAAKFDLVLNASESDGGLALNLIYNTDLFEESTIKRMMGHFENLLEAIVAAPGEAVTKLSLLGGAEREQLLQEWNETGTEYRAGCVHELFAEQVRRTPGAIALVSEEQQLSYQELEERANQVAGLLRERGLGAEALVGIVMERSVEMVVALLGVLKAGAAYVPLDPQYPEERLRYMIEDSGVRVVLTQEKLAAQVREYVAGGEVAVWALDGRESELSSGPAGPSRAAVSSSVGGENLAYVIYTSGSTGRPKAAMNTHGAIANRLQWMQEAYGLTAEDRVLQKTPFSFDVSVWEFFWPLITGARLVMARPGGHQDSGYLVGLIRAQQITTLHFVPSMLRVFLEQRELAGCGSVRQVICSGEELSWELQEQFFRRLGWSQLHNLYGPTEAAVDVSYWDCRQAASVAGVVPIGRPIANTQLYVLDEQLEPVAVGLAGELYIGGRGVGRGYLRRPETTAARFIPDPFSVAGGQRLYRTGDRVRWLVDGSIEFLGRLDHQVKMRGHRIELGEIESVLREQAGVSEAVVVVQGEREEERRLVAYVVSGNGPEVGSRELREQLRQRLPEYLVPAVIVALAELPLTANGKIDRRALPEPGPVRAAVAEQYEAPRTPVEQMLAALWSEVLKVDQIGIHENFFALGGDSLKGAVLINKLQQRLCEVVYVVALFDAPTIGSLACYLERKYSDAVARISGTTLSAAAPAPGVRLEAAQVKNLREAITPLVTEATLTARPKNRRAIFVLSPPRSGSTLLRVMLAGSRELFAPPELELLGFNTMNERRDAFTGRHSFSLEGAIRAVMELRGCAADEAKELISEFEDGQIKVQEFYRRLQEWSGNRKLVDKTPAYALDLAVLRRAEVYFENPLYIHLLRHPRGMIRSFCEAKLNEVFFRYKHQHNTRELAELIWTISHQNIRDFLREVPVQRHCQVQFEELVKSPRSVIERLSTFLDVEYCEAMIEPYLQPERRMTDGIYDVSRMHGDMKFHTHRGIDDRVADRWNEEPDAVELGDLTRELAASLGYPLSTEAEGQAARATGRVEALTDIASQARDGSVRLVASYAQQRLWFLDQLRPGDYLYNIPTANRLKGPLNVRALEQSLSEIIRRHETLRTSFIVFEDQPMPIISPAQPLSLEITDLSALTETKREHVALAQANAEARRPFDLSESPLIRAKLLRLGVEEHVLLITMHHIISDGWSLGLFFAELSTLYRAYSKDEQSGLPELAVQYADYAVWQREYLGGAVLEEQLGYWREQLGGAPAVLELPTDQPRPSLQSYQGAIARFRLRKEVSEAIKELSQREGVTLFMTLLAAFQVLLGRYSGQSEVVVGTPIAGRNRVEVEPLIGLFVNTLALRTDLSGNPSFRELLQRVREVCLGAYGHQDVPFEKLVEELQPERSLSHAPIFQVMFQLQNTPRELLALENLSLSRFRKDGTTAKFDITVAMLETELGLVGSFEYNTDLFEESTIKRMMGHFENLLEAIVAAPGEAVTKLSLLGGAEREQLLQEWNETGTEYRAGCVHELFAEQVRRTPGAIALVSEEQQLSYQELEERANQVAGLLRERGLGAEALVGIVMERSVEMVVALLGVLKAGAAYVPLDPQYPEERLRYMIEDSGVRVVLTQEKLAAQVREYVAGGEVAVWALDGRESELSSGPAGPSRAAVSSSVGGENLAYVIYTSGSSGQPKGVAITHQGLNNLLCTMREAPGLSRQDVLLAVTTLSFDIAALELFLPLCVGGRLVLATQQTARDGLALQRQLQETGATVMQATPATWRLLIESGWQGRAGLRLFCGGEALSRELAQALLARGGELWNLFGPTETTIWSALERVASEAGAVMIGRPVANTEVYVLDSEQQAVPIGVVGELYIGGAGLARGYLKRAELTAERFVPAGVGAGAGRRLYRTGDQVRWRRDGRLEYLGRMDQQVKVRGHRIELGEIEQVLERAGGVKQSVVVVREDVAGEQRLVAYVVSGAGAPVAPEELRKQLRERLPEYMIPGAIVALAELPLTPNGKVDRRALPVPELGRADLPEPYQAPRTATELTLCRIWSEVLRIDQVGINDNFFALGGHSLLGITVVAHVREALRVELPLQHIFESPTVAELSVRIERLSRAAQSRNLAAAANGTRKTGVVSYAQQRLWFLDQLEAGQSVYHIRATLRLEDELNTAVLEASFNEIVRRHEALRTTFAVVDGQPVQVIAPERSLSLPVRDLAALAPDERSAKEAELISDEARHPFNLASGPLIRASLLRLSEREHVLLLTLHQIISDERSVALLVRELTIIYRAYLSGQDSPLPELTLQYADFAKEQRALLQNERSAKQLTYWKKSLAGAPAKLELPFDWQRSSAPSRRGGTERLTISKEISNRLDALSRQEGTTSLVILLAAFQILLSRYSGQQKIVVGTPAAGRRRSELEQLIGPFGNTLVLCTDLAGDPSFRELLKRAKEVYLGAYAHQDLPFEKLVEELQPERSLSHAPLFQVMFTLVEAPEAMAKWPETEVTARLVGQEQRNFDLSLSIAKQADGSLLAAWHYRTELFRVETIQRMARHFHRVLDEILQDPGKRLRDVTLLGEQERQMALVEWNQTAVPYPSERSIKELFEQQVKRTPDAIALVSDRDELSYRELNERANQLAHFLRAQGIEAGKLVGICLERSFEMVVALLGVMKAGGAFVPISPEYPAARVQFMLEDAGIELLLTEKSLVEALPQSRARLLCLDADRKRISGYPLANLSGTTAFEQLAYIIYTSGSTGRPKGVMIPHRALSNHLLWRQARYPLTTSDALLQKASFSFDIAMWEILSPLIAGARLVLARPGGQKDMSYLTHEIRVQQITHVHFGPAMLQLFLDQPGIDNLDSLKHVFCGGEPLSSELQERFFARSRAELHNQYGPTETTIDVTVWDCKSEHPEQVVPIGQPIANTLAYIFDENLEPTPLGVAGELYIGGDSLAVGYLNGPALTAERFLPHPFSNVPGARLYRTGDRARLRHDGNIQFLGRLDHQLKIRGFRLEPGEIEVALTAHWSIKEAIVLAHAEADGERRLVAYLVPSEGQNPGLRELRGYLEERLPDYMIPAAFVALDRLPLTLNGKIDRRALPGFLRSHRLAVDSYKAPRTDLEKALAEIWAQLLHLERVGIDDNFFDLGGHSLLATQLLSRVRAVFGVEIALRAVFELPSVAELAAHIETTCAADPGVQAPRMGRVSRAQHLQLSFAQQRLWFLDQLEPGSISYNLRKAIRLRGELDLPALRQSLDEIIRRHEVLRTSFVMVDGQPTQVIAPAQSMRLLTFDLAALPAEQRDVEARLLARQAAEQAFDLASGPLIRARLLRMAQDEHILILAMHHIVGDGWSMGIFYRELGALYKAFREGELSPLPDLALQYADFAQWQRAWLQDQVLAEQLGYWKRQLKDVSILNLPTDIARPAMQTYRGAVKSFLLPKPLLDGLKEVCRREGVTLFMTLLAAMATLLARYSGQLDVVVGSPVANRNRAETEGLIGFFVNTLPIRTDLSGEPSFRELLRRVRDTSLGAYVHQDVPFEKLVEELQPERSLSHNPIYQVMFVLQNAPAEALAMPGLTATPMAIEGEMVKLDMALSREGNQSRGEAELSGAHELFEATRTVGQQLDLMLSMRELKLGIGGTLRYNADLFKPKTISRLLKHFESLLESIVDDPGQRLSQLPLLDQDERQQLLYEWNDTSAEFARDKCIHELFEAQVERTPDVSAIVFENQRLTYRQLNARANQLAHRLRAAGVGPEVSVGIMLERSLEMIVSLLAVLKAGGTYVPLDPQYPQDRLAFMIEDARARVLITNEHLTGRHALAGVLPICLDAERRSIAGYSDQNPELLSSAENGAYVIYTSGSTGKPKGVLIQHRSLVNYVETASREYAIGVGDRLVQFASISFDTSAEEIYPCLTSGATLILRSDTMFGSIGEFLRQCERLGITILDLPTAYWHEMVVTIAAEDLPFPDTVRLVIIGGERALPERLAIWQAQVGAGVRLVNSYGPTEATIVTTMCDLGSSADTSTVEREVPIGRAIQNAQAYVLDEQLQPVPVGVPGQLHIGGVGLARGYLCRPELTAERFIPNPFSTPLGTIEPGARLYCTGDRARYLDDGTLQFLGRMDNQVKIRGFRIEPGEVEQVLCQYPATREAVVEVKTGGDGEQRMVAYVALSGDPAQALGELRRFIKEHLPDYMIPSTFVTLDELPLTPSGKIDRRALPEPGAARPETALYAEPCTHLERLLCGIWADVLNIEQVGIEDNFFDLGGHSLLATRLLSRIRDVFEINLPLRYVFEAPTVAGTADALAQLVGRRESVEKIAEIFISLAQLSEMEAEQLHSNSLVSQ